MLHPKRWCCCREERVQRQGVPENNRRRGAGWGVGLRGAPPPGDALGSGAASFSAGAVLSEGQYHLCCVGMGVGCGCGGAGGPGGVARAAPASARGGRVSQEGPRPARCARCPDDKRSNACVVGGAASQLLLLMRPQPGAAGWRGLGGGVGGKGSGCGAAGPRRVTNAAQHRRSRRCRGSLRWPPSRAGARGAGQLARVGCSVLAAVAAVLQGVGGTSEAPGKWRRAEGAGAVAASSIGRGVRNSPTCLRPARPLGSPHLATIATLLVATTVATAAVATATAATAAATATTEATAVAAEGAGVERGREVGQNWSTAQNYALGAGPHLSASHTTSRHGFLGSEQARQLLWQRRSLRAPAHLPPPPPKPPPWPP